MFCQNLFFLFIFEICKILFSNNIEKPRNKDMTLLNCFKYY